MDANTKLEVIYYELVKMEQRLDEKVSILLKTEDSIKSALEKFEILQKDLLNHLKK